MLAAAAFKWNPPTTERSLTEAYVRQANWQILPRFRLPPSLFLSLLFRSSNDCSISPAQMKSRHSPDVAQLLRVKKANVHCIFTVLLAETQKPLPSRHRPQVPHTSLQCGTVHQTRWGSAMRGLRRGQHRGQKQGYSVPLKRVMLPAINDRYCSGVETSAL